MNHKNNNILTIGDKVIKIKPSKECLLEPKKQGNRHKTFPFGLALVFTKESGEKILTVAKKTDIHNFILKHDGITYKINKFIKEKTSIVFYPYAMKYN